MAIDGTLHKIVWGGQLALTETWSCGLHFIRPTDEDLVEVGFTTALTAWMQRSGTQCNLLAKLEWVKINKIDPITALYVDQGNPRTFFYPTPVAGTGNAGHPQISVAVSTVTELARGRSSKGRFYPPTGGIQANVGTDGRVLAAFTGAMATSAAQLITDFNGAGAGECVVFSRIGQLVQEITGVRVGRIADTQQRRRRNLVEDYQAAAVA